MSVRFIRGHFDPKFMLGLITDETRNEFGFVEHPKCEGFDSGEVEVRRRDGHFSFSCSGQTHPVMSDDLLKFVSSYSLVIEMELDDMSKVGFYEHKSASGEVRRSSVLNSGGGSFIDPPILIIDGDKYNDVKKLYAGIKDGSIKPVKKLSIFEEEKDPANTGPPRL